MSNKDKIYEVCQQKVFQLAKVVPYYLSIDLDFWDSYVLGEDADTKAVEVTQWLQRLIRTALDSGIPTLSVMNHQQLLPSINSSYARFLLNLDEHSDLLHEAACRRLHCGNWVSYVKWRQEGQLVWVRPNENPEIGDCNGEYHIWDRGCTWRRMHRCYQHAGALLQMPDAAVDALLQQCKGIGVCQSPRYTTERLVRVVMPMLASNNVKFIAGDPMELRSVERRPSQ